MLLKAVFLVATGIFTRPKDPVTQELRHFSIDNAGDAGRNFDEDIFMAVGSHADLSTTHGPSAREDSASWDVVNASDPAGRNASLLQGLSLASVEQPEQALGLGTKAEAVQETETTVGAKDTDEVEGLLETAQEETASEVSASSLDASSSMGTCKKGKQKNPEYTAALDRVSESKAEWSKAAGNANANYTKQENDLKKIDQFVYFPRYCCMVATMVDKPMEVYFQNRKQKVTIGTAYSSDTCECFEFLCPTASWGFKSTTDGNFNVPGTSTACPKDLCV